MTRTLPGLIVIALLLLPLVLTPFRREEVRSYVEKVEKRARAATPRFRSASDVLDERHWTALSDAIVDRFSLRDVLIPLKRRIDYDYLGQQRFGDVVRGKDGWLFYIHSLKPTAENPEAALVEAESARTLMLAFLAGSTGKRARVNVLVAPDKASIYPEKLSDWGRHQVELHRASRDVLQQAFAHGDAPELIDVWKLYREARARSETFVYDRHGTHHTVTTSFRMAKAIVEAARVGIFDESAITPSPNASSDSSPRRVGELAEMAGLLHLTGPIDEASLVREGVSFTSGYVEGRPATDVEVRDGSRWSQPVRVSSASASVPMIGGSTLVLQDSFIGSFLRVPLMQYFADISFIHADDVSNCELARALDEYDRIFIEVVERRAAPEFNRLFAPCPPELVAGATPLDRKFDASLRFGLARSAEAALELTLPSGAVLAEAGSERARALREGIGSIVFTEQGWRATGWALDVENQRRPDRIVAFRADTLSGLSTKLAFSPRADIARNASFGAIREADIGFVLHIAAGPELERAGVYVLAVYPDFIQRLHFAETVPASWSPTAR